MNGGRSNLLTHHWERKDVAYISNEWLGWKDEEFLTTWPTSVNHLTQLRVSFLSPVISASLHCNVPSGLHLSTYPSDKLLRRPTSISRRWSNLHVICFVGCVWAVLQRGNVAREASEAMHAFIQISANSMRFSLLAQWRATALANS